MDEPSASGRYAHLARRTTNRMALEIYEFANLKLYTFKSVSEFLPVNQVIFGHQMACYSFIKGVLASIVKTQQPSQDEPPHFESHPVVQRTER